MNRFFIILFFVFTYYSFAQVKISSWLIAGPFFFDEIISIKDDTVLSGRTFDEKPRGGKYFDGKIWYTYKKSIIDFYKIESNESLDNTCFFAAIYIFNKEKETIRHPFFLNYDEKIDIFLNGKNYFSFNFAKTNVIRKKVYIELQQGWNVLILQLYNKRDNFVFSAEYEESSDLIIQTQYPYTLKNKEYSPPRLKSLNKYKVGNIVLNENNSFLFSISNSYCNSSISNIDRIKYQVFIDSKPIITKNIKNIENGEIFDLNFTLSLNDIFTSNNNIHIAFFIDERKIYIDSIPKDVLFSNLLLSLFSPIQVQGWDRIIKKGKNIFIKEFKVPKYLEDFELDFSFKTTAEEVSVMVNNNLVFDGIINQKEFLNIKSSSGKDESIKLEIISNSEDNYGNSISLVSSNLFIRNKVAELILGNLLYSQKLTKKQNDDIKKIFEEVFYNIIKKKYDANLSILTKIESSNIIEEKNVKNFTISNILTINPQILFLNNSINSFYIIKTFESLIENIKKDKDLIYNIGQAQYLSVIEKDKPLLFNEIKKIYNTNNISTFGGFWADVDLFKISGELLFRNYLYGSRYFKEKFGKDLNLSYSLNTSSYTNNFPYLMNLCGINKFILFKPIEQFSFLKWESINNSSLIIHRPFGNYNSQSYSTESFFFPDKYFYHYAQYSKEKYNLNNILRFCTGDEKGLGPSTKEIYNIKFLDTLKSYPSNIVADLNDYFDDNNISSIKIDTINENILNNNSNEKINSFIFPDENSFESLLSSLEIFSIFNNIEDSHVKTINYRDFWCNYLTLKYSLDNEKIYFLKERNLLLNNYYSLFNNVKDSLLITLKNIARKINTLNKDKELIPIVIFNSLNWNRKYFCQFKIKKNKNNIKLFNDRLIEIPVAVFEDGNDSLNCIFVAENIPSLGYSVFWYKYFEDKQKISKNERNGNFILENKYYKIAIDKISGSIYSIYDKNIKKEILIESSLGGRIFLVNEDLYESNLDFENIDYCINPKNIDIIENNVIRKIVQLTYEINNSIIQQQITLYENLPSVFLNYRIFTKEKYNYFGIKFDLEINDSSSISGLPFYYKTSKNNSMFDNGKNFVLLNNTKNGLLFLSGNDFLYSINGNSLYILYNPLVFNDNNEFSLVFSSIKRNDLTTSIKSCFELFSPPITLITDQHTGKYGIKKSFIQTSNNIIISALKQSEDSTGMVMRFFDITGKKSDVIINNFVNSKYYYLINSIENKISSKKQLPNKLLLKLKPNEIKSVLFEYNLK